jgi:hypothetical protein
MGSRGDEGQEDYETPRESLLNSGTFAKNYYESLVKRADLHATLSSLSTIQAAAFSQEERAGVRRPRNRPLCLRCHNAAIDWNAAEQRGRDARTGGRETSPEF